MWYYKRCFKDILSKTVMGRECLLFGKRTFADIRTLLRLMKNWKDKECIWPNNMNIELTNVCNANCIFCAYQYQNQWRKSKGIISNCTFQNAVDSHSSNGGKFISLTSPAGETLIDPDLVGKIKYIVNKGIAINFFTNGILLDKVDISALLDSGLHGIVISTAPLKREYFETIYRSEKYNELLRGIKKLLLERNKHYPNISINISFRSHLSYRETLGQADFVEEIFHLLNPEEKEKIEVMNSFDSWCGQIQQKDLIGNMRVQKSPLIKRIPCKWTFIPMVFWDGKVRACGCRYAKTDAEEDDLFLGNINNKKLEEIWLGDKTKVLHRKFTSGNIPTVCKDCSMYSPC
jgi:MoaA/NifB/PqqE/SkfB family radical SAM enzyme